MLEVPLYDNLRERRLGQRKAAGRDPSLVHRRVLVPRRFLLFDVGHQPLHMQVLVPYGRTYEPTRHFRDPPEAGATSGRARTQAPPASGIQGYLAQKKPPPRRTLQCLGSCGGPRGGRRFLLSKVPLCHQDTCSCGILSGYMYM